MANRTQSVIVDDHVSQVSSLSDGVPQGSVLGPVLFILYAKTLSDLIQCHSIESQSFVDDTQLLVSVPQLNIQLAVSSLETCLSDIQTWLLENKRRLNNNDRGPPHLPISVQSANPPPSLSVAVEISFSSAVRNLGFYIACHER